MSFSRILDEVEVGGSRLALFHTARGVAAQRRRSAAPRGASAVLALSPSSGSGPRTESDQGEPTVPGLLDQMLGRIPQPLRTVYILHEIEDVSVMEIARMQGVPEGKVASRLRRAQALFQKLVLELRDSILDEESGC